MSTGASTDKDIQEAINIIKQSNNQIALLQCTAKYPAPLSSINLKVILELKEKYNLLIGISDHSREPLIAPLGAVALGAKIIEKHFTLDNNLPGPDHKFAITAEELKDLVKSIRELEQALKYSKKDIQTDEKELYDFARRYIYSIKPIKQGESFSKDNIAVLRSGKAQKGLHPKYFEKLLNQEAKTDIKENEPIKEDQL